MLNRTLRLTRLLAWSLLIIVLAATVSARQIPPINTDRHGLAVRGYDVVAYTTLGRPTQGHPKFEVTWSGARWRFLSAENRDQFLRDPAKFAPQFGGYCAWAVSRNYTADADPAAWKIVDGRLYLNYSTRVQAKWSEDIPGNIAKGRANWPSVLGK